MAAIQIEKVIGIEVKDKSPFAEAAKLPQDQISAIQWNMLPDSDPIRKRGLQDGMSYAAALECLLQEGWSPLMWGDKQAMHKNMVGTVYYFCRYWQK